jgi:hypothetical protein
MLAGRYRKTSCGFLGAASAAKLMVQQIAGSPAIFAAPASWLTLLLQVVGNAPADHGSALH